MGDTEIERTAMIAVHILPLLNDTDSLSLVATARAIGVIVRVNHDHAKTRATALADFVSAALKLGYHTEGRAHIVHGFEITWEDDAA